MVSIKAIIGFLFFILQFYIAVGQQTDGNFIKLPGKFPVTHHRFSDDTTKLQFAIISDVWGGRRVGVFEDAIDKIELLQPQFVISVGDLTDGKTYDTTVMDKQWDEFDKSVNSLSMPFFYVPGNHDIGNPAMEKEWRKRMGSPYYHFVYKDALFLCINTEDGGHGGIRDEQVAYFKKVIADNANVRWTFLFMHRPVWQGKNEREEGYEKIEAFLKGRNYTLFSGHHHTYLNVVKNGNEHFVLGTTGGGSDLRGEKFGEFDHITWVTLETGDQPKIINLKLNGLVKDDIVNENTFPITNTLINEDWLIAPSYVSQMKLEKSISPTIVFNNPTQYPLKISGDLPNLPGYKISPRQINVTIQPHTKQDQILIVAPTTNSTLDLSRLPFIDVSLHGQYIYDSVSYELPANKRLLLDWKHELPIELEANAKADRQFTNADTAGFISIRNPEYLQNKWYWYNTGDCLLQFKLMRDASYVYLLALIKDDQLVLHDRDQQDLIYVQFEDKIGVATRFTILPDALRSTIVSDDKTALGISDVQLKTNIVGNSLIKLLLRIPVSKIMKPDHSIRFNIGYRDQDNNPEKENATIFWKPVWGTETDYKNSGTFILK